MGADLIGYHLRGPATCSPARITAAKRHMQRIERISTIPESKRSRRDTRAWNDLLNRISAATGIDDTVELAAEADGLTRLGGAFVDDFIAVWNGDGRDISIRDDGTRRSFFAGDMSWGDTPDGDGYTTANTAAQTGILPLLGIS